MLQSFIVKPSLYYISDQAFAHIVTLAREQEYILPSADQRVHGISTFCNKLSECIFIDTRPLDIQKAAIDAMEHSVFLQYGWTMQYPRRQRTLTLTPLTLQNFLNLSLKLGITPPNKPNALFQPTPIIQHNIRTFAAAVLEAIGIEWLTPNPSPFPPFSDFHRMNNSQHRIRAGSYKEIDW